MIGETILSKQQHCGKVIVWEDPLKNQFVGTTEQEERGGDVFPTSGM